MPLVTYTANEMGLQAEGGLVKEWHVPLKHLVRKAKPLCTVQIQGGCIVLYAQEDMIVTDIYCDVGNTFATHMPLFTGNIFKGQTEQPRPGKDTSNPSTVYRNAGTGKAEGLNSIINDIRPPGDKVSSDTTYRIAGNGGKEAFIPPSRSTTARDTSYRVQSRLRKEYLNALRPDLDSSSTSYLNSSSRPDTNHQDQQTGRSNTTYRNAGAGKVEVAGSVINDVRSPINSDSQSKQPIQQPISSTSTPNENKRNQESSATNTAYRNAGAGIVEVVGTVTSDVRSTVDTHHSNTTYRNAGAGQVEITRASSIDPQSHAEASNSNRRSNRQPIANNSKPPTNKRFTFKTSVSHFDYGKLMHWTKKTGSKFLANEVICEITCFTSRDGAPHTEFIRAPIEVVLKEKLVTVNDRIEKGMPLFRYQELVEVKEWEQGKSERLNNKQQTTNTTCTRNQSAQFNAGTGFIVDPIEGVDEFISMVRNGYAFQVRDVLERIINAERERIEEEKAVWRFGAGVVAFGIGVVTNGLDVSDFLAGWTFSNIGAAAHQLASKEQIEFLKKLQSEWLVLDRSPLDIRRRLGEPQGRFIGISRANILDMFNIHQSGSRGFHMVELDHAGNIAKGFKDPQSLEVLQRSYDEEDIGIISSHFYPSKITPLKLARSITPEEARTKDPYFSQLSKAGAPFRVVYSDDSEGIMYKIQIPHHSDY